MGYDDSGRRTNYRDRNRNYNDFQPHNSNPYAEPFKSFRSFVLAQTDDSMGGTDVVQSYEKYKEAYRQFQASKFFDDRIQDVAFLKEKYHPELVLKSFLERKASRRKAANEFLSILAANGFDSLSLVRHDCDVSETVTVEAIDLTQQNSYFISDPLACCLYFQMIPSKVSRWDILEHFKDIPGFKELFLSDPDPNSNLSRMAWVLFESEESCDNANREFQESTLVLKDLDGFSTLPLKAERDTIKMLPIAPDSASKGDRISRDIQQTADLIKHLDTFWAIVENTDALGNEPLQMLEKDADQRRPSMQLDLQLLYLRRVHSVCYYSGEMHNDSMALWTKCGPTFVRRECPELNQMDCETQSPFLDKIDESYRHMITSLDQFELPQVLSEDADPIKSLWLKDCDEQTVKVEQDRWRCGVCQKMFKGANYVHKHLRNKHDNRLDIIKQQHYMPRMKVAYLADPLKLLPLVENINDGKNIKMDEGGSLYEPIRRQHSHHQNKTPYSMDGDPYRPRSHQNHPRNQGTGGGHRPNYGYGSSEMPPRGGYRDLDAPKPVKEPSEGNIRSLILYDDII